MFQNEDTLKSLTGSNFSTQPKNNYFMEYHHSDILRFFKEVRNSSY